MFAQFVDFYLNNEYGFAATQLALAMFGMGATLHPSDFTKVFKSPHSLFDGLLIQLLGVFCVAYFFIQVLSPEAGVIIGIALCAAVPGGTTSNIFTHLGKGNTALSVSLTTVSSFACLLTSPFILSLLLSNDLPADFSMPAASIAFDIVFNLLVPLFLGMLVYRFASQISEGVAKWSIRLSLLVIVGIVVGASGAGRLNIKAFGFDNAAIIGSFIFVLMVVSFLLPKLFARKNEDVIAISMEVTVRNINLGLLIHVAFFAGGQYSDAVANKALLAMLLYGALQMLLCIPLIMTGRWMAKS